MTRFLTLLFVWFSFVAGTAQDIHFAQYYNSPLNINPALTGVFEADMRFIANYRSQWNSVEVPYNTLSGSFDLKYFHKKFENGYFGGGFIFNHDQAGDSELSLTQFSLSGSYTQILNENMLMTAGFQAGPGQRAFNTERLTWHNQHDGEQYNPLLSSRENFRTTNLGFIDLSAGINLFIRDEDERAWANVGISMFHINQPRMNFTDETEQFLPSRFTVYSFGNIVLTDQSQLILHAMGNLQNSYNEVVVGAGYHYQLSDEAGKALGIRFLTTYRPVGTNDAIVPMLEFHYNAWRLGLSYDINISDFKVATNGRGGPEFSLQYVITKVKPPKEFKVCPIF